MINKSKFQLALFTLFISSQVVTYAANATRAVPNSIPNIQDELKAVAQLSNNIKFVGRGVVENNTSNSCLYTAPGYLIFQNYCRSRANGTFNDDQVVAYSIYNLKTQTQVDLYAEGTANEMSEATRVDYFATATPTQLNMGVAHMTKEYSRRLGINTSDSVKMQELWRHVEVLKTRLEAEGFQFRFEVGGVGFNGNVAFDPEISKLKETSTLQDVANFRKSSLYSRLGGMRSGAFYCLLRTDYGLSMPNTLYKDPATQLFHMDMTVKEIVDKNKETFDVQNQSYRNLPYGMCRFANMNTQEMNEVAVSWFPVNSQFLTSSTPQEWYNFKKMMKVITKKSLGLK